MSRRIQNVLRMYNVSLCWYCFCPKLEKNKYCFCCISNLTKRKKPKLCIITLCNLSQNVQCAYIHWKGYTGSTSRASQICYNRQEPGNPITTLLYNSDTSLSLFSSSMASRRFSAFLRALFCNLIRNSCLFFAVIINPSNFENIINNISKILFFHP